MKKIIIKTGKVFNLIDLSIIDYIKSEGNYSRLFCGNKTYVVTKSLNALREKLDESFLRINKTTVVNIEKIKVMKEVNYNKHVVEMTNEKVFLWGRPYKKKMIDQLKI